MPTPIIIPVNPASAPIGWCPQSWQEVLNQAAGTVVINSGTGLIFSFGPNQPPPEFQMWPWLKTVAGAPSRWYVFYLGKWTWPYRIPANSQENMIWTGSLIDLGTYDGGGGVSDPVTATTGPFWIPNPLLAGRVPLGAGVLPSTASIAIGQTGGEDLHTLTSAESGMNTHSHIVGQYQPGPGSIFFAKFGLQGFIPVPTSGVQLPVPAGYTPSATPYPSPPTGDILTSQPINLSATPTTPHNTLPPYLGVTYAIRTARVYWTP